MTAPAFEELHLMANALQNSGRSSLKIIGDHVAIALDKKSESERFGYVAKHFTDLDVKMVRFASEIELARAADFLDRDKYGELQVNQETRYAVAAAYRKNAEQLQQFADVLGRFNQVARQPRGAG